jgi:hypothetical protein
VKTDKELVDKIAMYRKELERQEATMGVMNVFDSMLGYIGEQHRDLKLLTAEITDLKQATKPPMNWLSDDLLGFMPCSLTEIIEGMQIGQVAKAYYGGTEWYITKTEAEQFRYCDEGGRNVTDLVPLTRSEMQAMWIRIK